MNRPDAFVPVAETVRSGATESVHFGAVVALTADGSVAFRAGDPGVEIYPRSSNKQLQATAMVELGLRLPPDLLALVCASHDGTPIHREAALRILDTAGLDESALRNTPDYPINAAAAADVSATRNCPAPSVSSASSLPACRIPSRASSLAARA